MSSHSTAMDKPKIGITIGDINGIGPEVIIKALNDNRILNYMTPVIYGSTKAISYYRKAFDLNDFNYTHYRDNKFTYSKVNIVNCWDEMIEINAGSVTPEVGAASFKALQKAVEHLKEGLIDAVVTAPINKNNIQSEEFKFAGHTEYFTENFDGKDSLMFLTSEDIKVGVVTGHIPLKDVSKNVTKELIIKKLKIMEESLRVDFGISKPRIAVLGLNPHAGEEGLLGSEDGNVIKPAIDEVKNKGKLVFGPYPADGFFGKGEYKKFDAVLAMYHDQGLIPFKTLAFNNGVNFTAGLSIIRTSPDHGTAYDIAGKNVANESSMREAIFMAYDIFKNRSEQKKES
ncbi:4-hydroxythreonine-4-phosphate dehydrogenase PdxA [Fulvivirga lutimaris]|uniref:4-hydroxythreonine-4-phosphate dehydrogenase PdxA n=1 Tax=Fulvivirga lutimaris TaxID=1819566 RepID=UPI0012BD545E|nr:4-hydroxythreonine-4-phosphate dehydrogenase PdxA [Fulvivirga lutimaris]MTI40142.1 4-hydroxythreonine-4-phosphate dehydrogenase PdxA [Fulvivirga lutimaris]